MEYRPQYTNPIQIASGEKIRVGDEDKESSGWKWCQALDGRAGWVPIELISGEDNEATILEDYSARELPLGEEVTVEEARHGWLLVRNAQEKRGWIPASHV